MAKKTNKSGSSWAVPFVIATTALVALLGFTTKGYTDWTFGITNEETPTTEELPGSSEQPGTSEEQPVEPTLPEDTAFDIMEKTDNYTYDDLTNVLDLHYDSVTEKEESLYWRFQCSLNFDTNDCCLYDDNHLYITTSDEIFTITIQNESFSVTNNLNGENSYWEEVDPGQYVLDVRIDMIRSGYNYYLKINNGDYLHYEDPNKSLEISSPMLKTSWGDERSVEVLIENLSCIHDEAYVNHLLLSDETLGFDHFDEEL